MQKDPRVLEKAGEAWRLKRLPDEDLVKLASEVGLNLDPVLQRVRAATVGSEGQARRREAATMQPEGAFQGTIVFPLELKLLGITVQRTARIAWGYTPEWEHLDARTESLVSAALQAFGYALEVAAEPDDVAYVVDRDGRWRARPQRPTWTKAGDLLIDGVLPSAVLDHVEKMIDADARAQDARRRELVVSPKWAAFTGGQPPADLEPSATSPAATKAGYRSRNPYRR